jgi:hypothetical protein
MVLHIECLKYVHENGCDGLDSVAGYEAARGGQLECLKYVHENGAAWNYETCLVAAQGGSL